MKIPSIAGLRSFLFGLLALIATESALIVLIVKVKDSAVVMALAPIFAGFFSAVGVVVGAVIVKHSVESLATGGGIAGAWKTLTTPAKPGDPPSPPPAPPAAGFARLSLLVLLAAVTGALIVGEAHAATAAPACKVRHDAHGFVRSQAVKLEFIRSSPQGACPATGKRALPCPGYEAHHIVWLSCGGEDRPENLVWLSTAQHDAVHAATVCKAKCVVIP